MFHSWFRFGINLVWIIHRFRDSLVVYMQTNTNRSFPCIVCSQLVDQIGIQPEFRLHSLLFCFIFYISNEQSFDSIFHFILFLFCLFNKHNKLYNRDVSRSRFRCVPDRVLCFRLLCFNSLCFILFSFIEMFNYTIYEKFSWCYQRCLLFQLPWKCVCVCLCVCLHVYVSIVMPVINGTDEDLNTSSIGLWMDATPGHWQILLAF